MSIEDGITVKVKRLERDVQELWKEVKLMRHRPPVWCTVTLTIMGTALGALVNSALAG